MKIKSNKLRRPGLRRITQRRPVAEGNIRNKQPTTTRKTRRGAVPAGRWLQGGRMTLFYPKQNKRCLLVHFHVQTTCVAQPTLLLPGPRLASRKRCKVSQTRRAVSNSFGISTSARRQSSSLCLLVVLQPLPNSTSCVRMAV